MYCAAVEDDPSRRVDASLVSAWMKRLPPKQREVIYLRHFEELSFRQIAEVIGVPTFTAASRYRLGLRRLRRMMGERG